MEGNVKGFMMHNEDDQDQLPLELQQALHFSSGSEADSNAVLKASSNNNSKNSCSDSFTSSSPQSELLALNLDVSSRPHHHHHHTNDNNNNSTGSMQQLLADDCSSTHFLLPRTAWPTPSCSSSIEEPTFTSSSSSSSPHGLSLNNSMAKTVAASQAVAFPSHHPDMLHAAASSRLPHSHASNILFTQDQYVMHNHAYRHTHPAVDPDFASYFNPVYMQQHADSAYDCDLYLQTDHVDPYHNSHQTHRHFFQHDGNAEEESYSQGLMIPITAMSQAQAYAHMGDPHNIQGGHPILNHSQSLPIYLDHMGHHSFEFWEPDSHALLNSDPASARILHHHHVAPAMSGSVATNEADQALRNDQKLRSSINYKDSCSSVEQDEEECVQGNLWKAREYAPHASTGAARISKPPNKRRCPADDIQEGAPPLKRSVSWNCMGSISIAGVMTINNSDNNHPSSKGTPPHNHKPASTAKQGGANDPQSVAARHRRERISERLKTLQQLVPNGSKVDLVTMLEKAINYVKFLQLQVKVLATDEYWPTPLNKFPQVALPLNLLDPQVKNPAKDDQTIQAENNSSDSKVEA